MCWIVLVPCPALPCLTWSILVRSGLPMAYLVLSCAALHCPALWSVVLCCLTCSCLVMSCAVSCARVWSHLFGSSEVWSGLVLSVRHGLVWSGLSCLVFFFLYCFCVFQACCVLFDWSLSCQVWCVLSCFVLSSLVVASASLRLSEEGCAGLLCSF